MATCPCEAVFCWIVIAVDFIISALVFRSFWMVVMACMMVVTYGVFWNLAIRTLMAANKDLNSGFGHGWSSAESIQASAFLR